MKANLFLVGMIAIFASSCSDDGPAEAVVIDPVITHWIVTQTWSQNGTDHGYILDYSLAANQLISYTTEVSAGGSTVQGGSGTNYYYDSQGHLVNAAYDPNANTHYYYSLEGNLIGSYDEYSFQNSRYVYLADGIVYIEEIDLPYDNPAAQVLDRYVAQLNADGVVLSMGRDLDLDGIPEFVNTFTVNAQGDVDSATVAGILYTYSYSNIVNTSSVVEGATFGAVRSLSGNFRSFASDSIQYVNPTRQSRHLTTEQWASGNYEAVNGWMSKETNVEVFESDPPLETTTVYEYVFQ